MKNFGVPADPDRTIPVGGLGVTAAVRRRMIKDHAWQLRGKTPNFVKKTKLGEIISTKE